MRDLCQSFDDLELRVFHAWAVFFCEWAFSVSMRAFDVSSCEFLMHKLCVLCCQAVVLQWMVALEYSLVRNLWAWFMQVVDRLVHHCHQPSDHRAMVFFVYALRVFSFRSFRSFDASTVRLFWILELGSLVHGAWVSCSASCNFFHAGICFWCSCARNFCFSPKVYCHLQTVDGRSVSYISTVLQ
jgi:hypothetical protein